MSNINNTGNNGIPAHLRKKRSMRDLVTLLLILIALVFAVDNAFTQWLYEHSILWAIAFRTLIIVLALPFIVSSFRFYRKAEEERSMFLTMMDNMQEGVFACDHLGRIVYYNQASADLYKKAQDEPLMKWGEAIGIHYRDGTPMQTFDTPMFRSLAGEWIRSMEVVIQFDAKPPRTMLCNSSPILDYKGSIRGAVVVFQDMTKLKAAKQQLRKSFDAELELSRKKSEFQHVLDHLEIMIWSWDVKTQKLLYVSESIRNVYGVEQGTFMQDEALQAACIFPEDWGLLRSFLQQLDSMHQDEDRMLEFRGIHQGTGELRWLQARALLVCDETTGLVASVYGMTVDVTERRRPAAIMKAQNEILSLIALGRPLPDVLETICLRTNDELPERLTAILLVSGEKGFIKGAAPHHPDRFDRLVDQITIDPSASTGPFSQVFIDKKPIIITDIERDARWQGTPFQAETTRDGLKSYWTYPLFSSTGRQLGIFTLASGKTGGPQAVDSEFIEAFANLAALTIEREQAHKDIEMLAFYDPLTSLGNRRLLTDRLEWQIAESRESGEPFALFFIDLDQFKFVNDSLGHDAGDSLLQQIAERLSQSVGADGLLARIGGDEFVLLLPGAGDAAACEAAAERLLRLFDEPVHVFGYELRMTPSIGISLYPEHGTEPSVLMKHADAAMYMAKEEKLRHYKLFHSAMKDTAYEHFVFKNELNMALANNEFELHYQPQVELATGTVRGVEALVRWRHPTRGLVLPMQFVPLAEELGVISKLGEWVLREACRQGRSWIEQGLPPLRVAVNVTVQQFHDPEFVRMVRRNLELTGLEPGLLELEITESALLTTEQRMLAILFELEQLGVSVSIDDFGSGYSSLGYLKKFKVNALKIDRSFVQDVPHDAQNAAITNTIISLAHNLGMTVTAEGAETAEQVDFLLRQGCDSVQGFYYSKPVPAADLPEIISSCRRPLTDR